MKPREQYDKMIAAFEEGAHQRYKKANDTVKETARLIPIEVREMNAIMKFFTGRTANAYVKERQMMAAYSYLINAKKPDIDEAIEFTEYDNHSSFTKRFTKMFGISPKKASGIKDDSLVSKPMTWDVISESDVNIGFDEIGQDSAEEREMFGISAEQSAVLKRVEELGDIYGFSNLYRQLALELYEALGIEMEEAYRFMDSLHSYMGDEYDFGEDTEEDLSQKFEEDLREMAYQEWLHFMFFECNISVGLAYDVKGKLSMEPDEIMEQDPDLIYEYAHFGSDIDFNYLKRAYEYYMENANAMYSNENFEQFLDQINVGTPIEYAFEMIVPDYDGIDCDMTPDEEFEAYNFEADEEEYYEEDGYDDYIYYDEENDYYDRTDREDSGLI